MMQPVKPNAQAQTNPNAQDDIQHVSQSPIPNPPPQDDQRAQALLVSENGKPEEKADLALDTEDGVDHEKQALRARIEALTQEKNELTQHNEALQHENEALKRDKRTLQGENQTLTDKNTTLTNENQTLTDKNTTLTDENAALTDKNTTLTDENQTLTGENTSLSDENRTLKRDKKSLQDKNKALTQEKNSLAYDFESLKKRFAACSNELVPQNEQKNDADSHSAPEHQDYLPLSESYIDMPHHHNSFDHAHIFYEPSPALSIQGDLDDARWEDKDIVFQLSRLGIEKTMQYPHGALRQQEAVYCETKPPHHDPNDQKKDDNLNTADDRLKLDPNYTQKQLEVSFVEWLRSDTHRKDAVYHIAWEGEHPSHRLYFYDTILSKVHAVSVFHTETIHHMFQDARVLGVCSQLDRDAHLKHTYLKHVHTQHRITACLSFSLALAAAFARTAVNVNQFQLLREESAQSSWLRASSSCLIPWLGILVYPFFYHQENQRFFYERRYRGTFTALFGQSSCQLNAALPLLLCTLTSGMALITEALVVYTNAHEAFFYNEHTHQSEPSWIDGLWYLVVGLVGIQFCIVESSALAWRAQNSLWPDEYRFIHDLRQVNTMGTCSRVLIGILSILLTHTIMLGGITGSLSIAFKEYTQVITHLLSTLFHMKAGFISPTAQFSALFMCCWSVLYKFCLYNHEIKRWLLDARHFTEKKTCNRQALCNVKVILLILMCTLSASSDFMTGYSGWYQATDDPLSAWFFGALYSILMTLVIFRSLSPLFEVTTHRLDTMIHEPIAPNADTYSDTYRIQDILEDNWTAIIMLSPGVIYYLRTSEDNYRDTYPLFISTVCFLLLYTCRAVLRGFRKEQHLAKAKHLPKTRYSAQALCRRLCQHEWRRLRSDFEANFVGQPYEISLRQAPQTITKPTRIYVMPASDNTQTAYNRPTLMHYSRTLHGRRPLPSESYSLTGSLKALTRGDYDMDAIIRSVYRYNRRFRHHVGQALWFALTVLMTEIGTVYAFRHYVFNILSEEHDDADDAWSILLSMVISAYLGAILLRHVYDDSVHVKRRVVPHPRRLSLVFKKEPAKRPQQAHDTANTGLLQNREPSVSMDEKIASLDYGALGNNPTKNIPLPPWPQGGRSYT